MIGNIVFGQFTKCYILVSLHYIAKLAREAILPIIINNHFFISIMIIISQLRINLKLIYKEEKKGFSIYIVVIALTCLGIQIVK